MPFWFNLHPSASPWCACLVQTFFQTFFHSPCTCADSDGQIEYGPTSNWKLQNLGHTHCTDNGDDDDDHHHHHHLKEEESKEEKQ